MAPRKEELVPPARRWFRRAPKPVTVSRRRKLIALAIAATADVVQVALLPLFIEGAASPFNDALDAATAIALVAVLGFRWRLVFALAAELVRGFDLFPSWTAVVLSVAMTAPSEPPAGPEADPKDPS